MANENNRQVIVVAQPKSMGISILLSVLFGPLGMFYSTILGGVIMIFVTAGVALITFGLGILITWPICIIWAAIATKNYNNKLMAQANINMQ